MGSIQNKNILNQIIIIRNEKIIFDKDLAAMYEVETRVLKQAVKRNIDRFPTDFMFQLTNAEIETLVSQNVIPSKSLLGGSKPMVFTEHGVAMLSSVLNSKKAIKVNIAIIRVFVKLRKLMGNNNEIVKMFIDIKQKHDEKEEVLRIIYDVIDKLIAKDDPKGQMGFVYPNTTS